MIRRNPLLTFFFVCLFLVLGIQGVRNRLHKQFAPKGVGAQLRHSKRPLLLLLLLNLEVMIPSVLASLLVALWYFRRQARIAQDVLKRLHDGELSARLPAGKLARYGGLVETFNAMAQDIESLVVKLRKIEETRSETLKELAHDIRTPLSSLQLALENKSFNLARAEVAYVQKLVESLLVLAQIDEPDFKKAPPPLVLFDAVMKEMLPFQDLPEKLHVSWIVETSLPKEQRVAVDAFLFSRALRNLLSNAAHFAKHRVDVRLALDGDVTLTVSDDGDGFSAEALARFGERKRIRLVDPAVPGNVSLGLGTVIVTKIASHLGGTVTARNRPSGGAEVTLRLPAALLDSDKKAA